MPAEKFLKNVAGGFVEAVSVATGGAPSAEKIPSLDASGRLDLTMMPSGIGPGTSIVQASEALIAGDYVNIHNVASAFRVRKADAATAGKEAHGYVLTAVASGANATVFSDGLNTGVTAQLPGQVFLSTTPGIGSATAPTVAGQVSQPLGIAMSATSVNFERQPAILLA